MYNMLHKFLKDFNADMVYNDAADNKHEKVDIHSMQKLASTLTQCNGISQDDKDHQGKCKQKCISDKYDDIELDFW